MYPYVNKRPYQKEMYFFVLLTASDGYVKDECGQDCVYVLQRTGSLTNSPLGSRWMNQPPTLKL
jgi:hypothetical protein